MEFDSAVKRAGTLSLIALYLDMCVGNVFELVFVNQSCSVFQSSAQ